MIYIEILAETDYQDLYRISDGVLLVINKFKRIEYPSEPYFHVYTTDAKYKSYNKGCQKWLKVLKEDYKNKYIETLSAISAFLASLYLVSPCTLVNPKYPFILSILVIILLPHFGHVSISTC